MRISLIALLALGVASPALAGPPTRVSDPTMSKALADETRIVCRREHVVGSMGRKKVCMTRAEWQRRQDESQYLLDPSRRTIDSKANLGFQPRN